MVDIWIFSLMPVGQMCVGLRVLRFESLQISASLHFLFFLFFYIVVSGWVRDVQSYKLNTRTASFLPMRFFFFFLPGSFKCSANSNAVGLPHGRYSQSPWDSLSSKSLFPSSRSSIVYCMYKELLISELIVRLQLWCCNKNVYKAKTNKNVILIGKLYEIVNE